MNRVVGIVVPLYFILCLGLAVDEPVRVPRARYFFSPSAAPSGQTLAVNVSDHTPDGEMTSGVPTLLRMDEKPALVKRLSASESEDTDTPPRWTSDGRKLFYLTSTGLHSFSMEAEKSEILRKGSFAGLALSPDDSKLAFWNMSPEGQRGSYVLVVLDLGSFKEVRSWTVPNNYDADHYGFELAFSVDSAALFARTYDTEGATPLKRFDLSTGRVDLIAEDCSGMASSKRAVYFVQTTGAESALLKIDQANERPKNVISPFLYDDLAGSGTLRWLVARQLRTGKLAVVDTTTDHLAAVEGKCDSLTVLANDKILYFGGGSVGSSPAVCSPRRR